MCLAHPKICFKVYTNKTTRAEARDLCKETGSRLVVLDTKEKNRAVSTYIRKNIGNSFRYVLETTRCKINRLQRVLV